MKDLGSRSLEILDAVVRLNIETGRPVSSGLVERSLNRGISSATIRSVMKGLEGAGYLDQPHISAGRLPTDTGFRVFVDRLQAGWSLRRIDIPAQVRQVLGRNIKDPIDSQERVKVLAQLLSRLTDNISIILGPSWDEVKAVRVEAYPRSARLMLMVVILDNSRVRTGLVELAEDHAPAIIEQAAAILTERIRGRTVAEIRGGCWESPDLLRTPASCCAAALSRAGRNLFHDLGEGELELEGVANVLDEPEFREPEPLKALLRFIESPRNIRRSLDRLGSMDDGRFGVWIGSENPVGPLRGFTVLTGRFELDGRPGTLAVLGPRRMSYQRAFQGIEIMRYLAREQTKREAS
ncbi:MAG: heat-inducible transcriptional repressor HrcA [Gemmatimonadales bacterium]|nr:heat-inducible transcriptional repressor HrcA [Gemmatimonadales bacterium]